MPRPAGAGRGRCDGAFSLSLASGTMRTFFCCTDMVTISPLYSLPVLVKVPMLAMMHSFKLVEPAPIAASMAG